MRNKLASEYRPSMDYEVLSSWAEDAAKQLEEMTILISICGRAFEHLNPESLSHLAAPVMVREFLEKNNLSGLIYAE